MDWNLSLQHHQASSGALCRAGCTKHGDCWGLFHFEAVGRVPVLYIPHRIFCTQHVIYFLNPVPAEDALWGSARSQGSHAWDQWELLLLHSSCCSSHWLCLFNLYRLSFPTTYIPQSHKTEKICLGIIGLCFVSLTTWATHLRYQESKKSSITELGRGQN